MKFKLDREVVYDGTVYIVWYYSYRRKTYALKNEKQTIFDIPEEKIQYFGNKDLRIYQNESEKYQLVADCKVLIFEGSKEDCLLELNKFDLSESNYHHLKILKPGEIIDGFFSY